MSKNKDGLRYPSIDLLLEKIDSKYKLVYAASKVATILENEKIVVKDSKSPTFVGKALEEILNDKVDIVFDEETWYLFFSGIILKRFKIWKTNLT